MEALPGAVEFIQSVKALGVDVFYVSNRFEETRAPLVNNLKQQGFPDPTREFLMLSPPSDTLQSKEQKRQIIRNKGYHVLLTLGDQLNDHVDIPTHQPDEKKQWIAQQQHFFNKDWFMLPNTLYGTWEQELADHYASLIPAAKHQARFNALPLRRYNHETDAGYFRQIMLANVWLQASADFHATAYQAYNQARQALHQHSKKSFKNPAIVVDIDGTLLDYVSIYNSPKHQNSANDNRHLVWFFHEMQKAKPIPGALNFVNDAQNEGYDIFYMTARPPSTLRLNAGRDIEEATIKQLQEYGFPKVNEEHIIFRDEYCPEGQKKCGKEFKRQAITSGRINGTEYQVVLYVGDYLTDFDLIEQGVKPVGKEAIKSVKPLFGSRYIIIPNPVNMSAQNRLYSELSGQDYSNMTQKEQAELRRRLAKNSKAFDH